MIDAVWTFNDTLGTPDKFLRNLAMRRGRFLSNKDYGGLYNVAQYVEYLTAENAALKQRVEKLEEKK